MSKPKEIKPLDGFSKASDADVVARGTNIQTSMTGNPHFPSPPVDLAALKAAIDALAALIAEALDGSKKVIAQKNKQRRAVVKMLKLLGRYVEINCDGDMTTFQTSGFEPAAPKVATPPLTEKIRKVEHGSNSGEIDVWLKAVRKASSYELRYAVANAGAATQWTTVPLSNAKAAVVLKGLTPVTTYLFQARALVKGTYIPIGAIRSRLSARKRDSVKPGRFGEVRGTPPANSAVQEFGGASLELRKNAYTPSQGGSETAVCV
jgi:hypothetical protein